MNHSIYSISVWWTAEMICKLQIKFTILHVMTFSVCKIHSTFDENLRYYHWLYMVCLRWVSRKNKLAITNRTCVSTYVSFDALSLQIMFSKILNVGYLKLKLDYHLVENPFAETWLERTQINLLLLNTNIQGWCHGVARGNHSLEGFKIRKKYGVWILKLAVL